MDWRKVVVESTKAIVAVQAGYNARALTTLDSATAAMWGIYVALPLVVFAGLVVYGWRLSGRAETDRSLAIMADLVRELTKKGRLTSVQSSTAKFTVEMKP